MDLIVRTPHLALWSGREIRCAVGRNGIIAAADKREGDGKTPAGRWAMRQVFYRPDRLAKPETLLPVRALDPDDGWCEQPADPNYNKLIRHPYSAAAERMWREDHLYDIVVVLGHNDSPVMPGMGSAIFFHLCRPDYSPSSGCITLPLEEVLTVLRGADAGSHVDVRLA